MLDDASPPESSSGAAVVEAAPPPATTMAKDEMSYLRVQLEAIQEATARSEREAVATMASHAEA